MYQSTTLMASHDVLIVNFVARLAIVEFGDAGLTIVGATQPPFVAMQAESLRFTKSRERFLAVRAVGRRHTLGTFLVVIERHLMSETDWDILVTWTKRNRVGVTPKDRLTAIWNSARNLLVAVVAKTFAGQFLGTPLAVLALHVVTATQRIRRGNFTALHVTRL